MVLIDYLDKGIQRFPEREAVRDGDEALTYREFGELVDRIASALIGEGLEPGARVAIYSPNHHLAFAAQYGAIRAGCIWVPVNFRNSAADMAQALADFEVEWLFFHSSNAQQVLGALGSLPALKGWTYFDPAEGADDLRGWVARHSSCKLKLGGVKAPKSIKSVESLPRSGNGKVLRREVRAPYWTGHKRLV